MLSYDGRTVQNSDYDYLIIYKAEQVAIGQQLYFVAQTQEQDVFDLECSSGGKEVFF